MTDEPHTADDSSTAPREAKSVKAVVEPDLRVTERILDGLTNDRFNKNLRTLATHSQQSHDRLLAYLAYLETRGYVRMEIRADTGRRIARITAAGLEAREALRRVVHLFDHPGVKDRL